MTTWLFDLGNSRLKFAPLLPDGSVGEAYAQAHDGLVLDPAWTQRLPAHIDAADVANVAQSPVRTALLEALARRATRISFAATLRHCAGVRIAYAHPRKLGVDRFLAMLGAHARQARPWLVVGVGTALTIDLLDAQGQHHGGRIGPSPTLMRQALHQRAMQLPQAGGRYLPFATDTEDALASGCLGAALGLVEHSLRAAESVVRQPLQILLHGGGAEAMRPLLPDAEHAPSLVLEGLARWSHFVDGTDAAVPSGGRP